MTELLVVDDSPTVCADLARLFSRCEEWHVRTAASGVEGLMALDAAPADVVLADMRMPGMDGAEFLLRTQATHPTAIRVLLAGPDDAAAVRCAASVAHQFVPKPLQGDTLHAVLDAVRDLRQLLSHAGLQAAVGKLKSLPTRPLTYWALTEALVRPSVTVAEVTAIVEHDPVIAGRVLQLANSAYFGARRQVASLDAAVAQIGFTSLQSIVAACEILAQFPDGTNGTVVDPHACACLARFIGQQVGCHDAFTAALLRDIGLHIVHPGPGADDPALPHALLHFHERTAVGFDHAEAGAYLLAMWGLPVALVRGVLYHATPYSEPVRGMSVGSIVWFAESLLRDLTLDEARAVQQYAEALGVEDRLDGWRCEAGIIVEETRGIAEVR